MKRKTLSPGTDLEVYLVKHEVDQDAFGVTYLVHTPANEDQRFQVREFFPASLSRRRKGQVYPIRKKLTNAFESARTRCETVFGRLSEIDIPEMVSVRDQFSAHNTHYLVSEWPEGETTAELLQEHGEFTPEQVRLFLELIFPALVTLEKQGLVHTGLSPMMIYRNEAGRPFINMPYAPGLVGEPPIVPYVSGKKAKPSAFIAPELLQSDDDDEVGLLSSAVDIYSLSAIAYTLLTGHEPAPAIDRLNAVAAGAADPLDMDALHNAAGDDSELLVAVAKGLNVKSEDRFSSMEAFAGFLAPAVIPAVSPADSETPPTPKRKAFPILFWATAAAVFLGVLVAGAYLVSGGRNSDEPITVEQKPPARPVDDASGDPASALAELIDPKPAKGIEPPPADWVEKTETVSSVPQDINSENTPPLELAETASSNESEDALSLDIPDGHSDLPSGSEPALTNVSDSAPALGVEPQTSVSNENTETVSPTEDVDLSLTDPVRNFDLPSGVENDEAEMPAEDEAEEETLDDFIETVDLMNGTPFRDCETCPELQPLKAGGFVSENGKRISIENAFSMSTGEVTLADYRAFMRATGKRAYHPCLSQSPTDASLWSNRYGASVLSPGFAQRPDHPVVCVSWEDAKSYAGWLSQKTGAVYRLPTSAEWSYASRGGQKTRYPWGKNSDDACEYANLRDVSQSVNSACQDGFSYTAPVTGKRNNSANLSGMAGNVAEWVEDCGKTGCTTRLAKGGSWVSSVDQARPDWERAYGIGTRHNTIGFRLVREGSVK